MDFPLSSAWLGLPPIADNICEGVVIRPVTPTYLRNGCRVLIKNKNARFAEKKRVKKHDAKLAHEVTYSDELNDGLAIKGCLDRLHEGVRFAVWCS